jgi:hypothetical protein
MDATTPLRRWLCAAGLILLAAGCETPQRTPVDDLMEQREREQKAAEKVAEERAQNEAAYRARQAGPVARPQMPTDPRLPISPGPQPPAAAPGAPVVTGAVTGQPVGAGTTVPAGYTPGGPVMTRIPVPSGIMRVKVVAIVGDPRNIITDQEVWEAVRQRKGDYLSLIEGPNGKQIVRDDEKEKLIYAEELRRVIERELILDEMNKRLKKANKSDVLDQIREYASKAADRQLREYKRALKVQTDEELQTKLLAPEGLTLPVIRRQIERQMMAEEYVRSMLKEKGKGVGLAEMREYYQSNPDEFRTEDRVKWLDIFISFNKFATPRAAYDHAMAVQQHAAAGGDFLALVKQHDHGVASQQNGEGIGEKRGEIRPVEVEPTVWSLQPGQVGGLVQTPTGYHVVKVVERQSAGVRPFDETVQDDIRKKLMRQLQDREYKKLVEDLWRKGVVKVLETPQ